MNYIKEIFSGKEGRLSAKRVIGFIIIFVAVALLLDSHISDRELNDNAFSSMLYTGGVMIVGGVLEGISKKKDNYYRSNDEY